VQGHGLEVAMNLAEIATWLFGQILRADFSFVFN
jgi:hypothetical protein